MLNPSWFSSSRTKKISSIFLSSIEENSGNFLMAEFRFLSTLMEGVFV